MSRLEKGTKVPFMGLDKAAEQELAIALADALRAELGSRSVAKTVARWTGVSDRAVKKMAGGQNGSRRHASRRPDASLGSGACCGAESCRKIMRPTRGLRQFTPCFHCIHPSLVGR